MYFDRFDICEAHLALEWDYSAGGWLQDRPSNVRRMEGTHIQLDRIGFKCGVAFRGYESLSENGQAIYHDLEQRWKLEETTPCLASTN